MQWWVKVGPLAKAAGDAVRDGRVKIHPQEMAKRYFDWVDNLHDWCISRQLWWGHRIPVWYGPNGEVVCVGPDEQPPTRRGLDPGHRRPGHLVLLRPVAVLHARLARADRRACAKFYPNSVLVTGYDILFFWVARMMMFGLYAMDGTPPFHTIALHGMVRDEFGKKMSKSFGNAVDPLDWMDTYGSDAVRFTLARGANPGVDVPIGEDWVQASRNFANKIWNATRFALMNGATVEGELPPAEQLSATDRWILSRLNETVAEVDAFYEDYQFAKLCDALYHFAWDEVFDWYVELSKTTFFAGGEPAEVSGRVLGEVLDVTLRLLHPVVPFVTETLWTTLTGGESVVIADWPADSGFRDDGRRAGDRAPSSRSSPRSAGSAPTRASSPARRSRPGSTWPAPRWPPHEAAIRQLLRLQPEGEGFTRHGDPAGRGRHGRARPVRHDRRRGRAQAPDEGPGRGREGEGRRPTAKLGNEAFLAKAPDHVVDKIRGRARQGGGGHRADRRPAGGRCRRADACDEAPGHPADRQRGASP